MIRLRVTKINDLVNYCAEFKRLMNRVPLNQYLKFIIEI